jgi:hypothetical protein
MTAKKKKKANPGPKADRLKIEGDWKDAVRRAIGQPKPASGWPKETKLKSKRKGGSLA